ncbi:hypothetical protein [Paraburkholderia sp.]|uniref:hypothetical protein n=1 Tax=Paraburkholderia sp. TaxID=1926495 RepID=UPI0039E46748
MFHTYKSRGSLRLVLFCLGGMSWRQVVLTRCPLIHECVLNAFFDAGSDIARGFTYKVRTRQRIFRSLSFWNANRSNNPLNWAVFCNIRNYFTLGLFRLDRYGNDFVPRSKVPFGPTTLIPVEKHGQFSGHGHAGFPRRDTTHVQAHQAIAALTVCATSAARRPL